MTIQKPWLWRQINEIYPTHSPTTLNWSRSTFEVNTEQQDNHHQDTGNRRHCVVLHCCSYWCLQPSLKFKKHSSAHQNRIRPKTFVGNLLKYGTTIHAGRDGRVSEKLRGVRRPLTLILPNSTIFQRGTILSPILNSRSSSENLLRSNTRESFSLLLGEKFTKFHLTQKY